MFLKSWSTQSKTRDKEDEILDSLPQYGTYAFIPYITSPTATNMPCLAIAPSPNPPPFKIKHTSTYTYCGPLLSPHTLPPSLHPWLTQTTTTPSALLSRLIPLLTFLHTFLENAGVQHYWLTLRATTPTQEYNTPRWHVDDDFFANAPTSSPNDARSQRSAKKRTARHTGWKLCTTLLGPATLFLRPSSNRTALLTLRAAKEKESAQHSHICSSIRCAACFATSAAVRLALADAFAGEATVQAADGEVAFFRIGCEEGAMHSEPVCGVDRVFVNVVPGTEGELRALMGRYGMGFPRAWSLGVPGGLGMTEGLVDGK